jgi:hypothetical protein
VNVEADSEKLARELYGEYSWIVRKTHSSDEVGGSIQVSSI